MHPAYSKIKFALEHMNVRELKKYIIDNNIVPNLMLNEVGCRLDIIKLLVEDFYAYTFSSIIKKAINADRLDIVKYIIEKIEFDNMREYYIKEIFMLIIININSVQRCINTLSYLNIISKDIDMDISIKRKYFSGRNVFYEKDVYVAKIRYVYKSCVYNRIIIF
jgi:hypothetical protein